MGMAKRHMEDEEYKLNAATDIAIQAVLPPM